ncbi:MAG: hypothetical protein DHS20C13_13860 [Thermodesulfobacteriota bacterium]|nr:MAG: hypothetical protein DHS20C13_13860 [Thermodesulfobacteriota bacterium]
MITLQKPRNFFGKCSAVLLLGLISIFAIGGCSDNGGGQGNTQALTENDFSNNPSLQANLENQIVVKFLEHPDSDTPENDTGETGNDTIPLRYSRTVDHTFCWEDDDGEAGHFMELDDSAGKEIFRLDVNGECKTVVLEAGDYVITLHHDGRIETTHPIFIIPNPENIEQAQNTQGLFNSFKLAAANMFKRIEKTVTKEAQAQTQTQTIPQPQPGPVEENVEVLLSTNRCVFCDLSGANLAGADLMGARLFLSNLTGANLIGANLLGANITFATLVNANLNSANLIEAEFDFSDMMGANMADADLSFAFLPDTNLENATFQGANLENALFETAVIINANLRDTVLFGADLTGADLSGADFTGADMRIADLFFANLTGANLFEARLNTADLNETNLTNANLAFADLTDARLLESNLTGAILFGADFSGALWCNACLCDDPSIGTCVGCPSADEVCTGS